MAKVTETLETSEITITLSGGHFGGQVEVVRSDERVIVKVDERGQDWVYSRLRSPGDTADFIGMKTEALILTPEEQKAVSWA